MVSSKRAMCTCTGVVPNTAVNAAWLFAIVKENPAAESISALVILSLQNVILASPRAACQLVERMCWVPVVGAGPCLCRGLGKERLRGVVLLDSRVCSRQDVINDSILIKSTLLPETWKIQTRVFRNKSYIILRQKQILEKMQNPHHRPRYSR